MNYPMLRKLRDELAQKANKTSEEEAMLKELLSLNGILNKLEFSLASASSNCPACGRPYGK